MIHPTAIIDPSAQIDSAVEIGPWCQIGPNVKMGKGNVLHSHVVIDGWTTIGENNQFFPFAVLGKIPQDLKYKGEETHLVIGNNNTIRESATLNLGTVQGGGVTRVGDHNLLMAVTHLGHDCIVGNHCILANNTGLAGHVILEDWVTLGGQCGVSQFVKVGSHAYIGGQSGLDRSVPPFCIAVGSRPTALLGANIVGLRRRNFTTEVISKINDAIKLWIRPDVQREQCLLEIESQYSDFPEIMQFVQFIRDSRTGVVR